MLLPNHYHILIVEDNLINQKVACRMLEKLGYQVEVANNGKEALDELSRRSFDVILMDCQMPVMDGYQATRQIRILEKDGTFAQRIPVLAITANAMSGDREKCLSAGMDDYATKPINKDMLITLLEKWLPKDKIVSGNDTSMRIISTTPILDNSAIADLQDDPEFLAEIIDLYFDRADETLSLMNETWEASNYDQFIYQAHTLMGSSNSIGAAQVQALSLQLEENVKAKDYENISNLLKSTSEALERVRQCLNNENRRAA